MNLSDVRDHAASVSRAASRDGAAHKITMQRDYDYAIEEVWSAWTTPERLRRWLGEPRGDLRIGGHLDLAMGDDDVIHILVRDCAPPANLVVAWDDDGVQSQVTLQLEQLENEQTRLTLTHSEVGAEDAIIYGPGWEEFLYVLDELLAGGTKHTVTWDRHGVVLGLGNEWRRVIAAAR